MKQFLADEWSVMKTWWSLYAGILTAGFLTAVPVIADRWPELTPTFISLFPKHGQQWAPIIGVILVVVARMISQAAVIDGFRRLRDHYFRRHPDPIDGAPK